MKLIIRFLELNKIHNNKCANFVVQNDDNFTIKYVSIYQVVLLFLINWFLID